MLVTYATPSVGFVSPNTASIPLFGSQDIGALGTTVSANSAQVGGGAGTDFEFTDANNFNSANGLAGTADITAGSFALPAGTTNVLQWQFDDTGSRLKEGVAFRVDISTTTVRDSAGNTVTFGSISTIDPRLPPLGVLPSPYTAARALDVSDDGQTVVGYLVGASRRAGFRWTPTDGYQVLPDLPGGPIDGIANTVSPSGALVGGFGTDSFASKAAIWTAGGTGQLALQLSLTGQLDRSEVLDISASDERAVGYHSSEYGTFACSWQLTDEPFATLRTLASIGGFPNIISAATGVDAMGTLAVGVYGSHAAIFPIGSFDATTKSADLAGGLSESTPLTLSRDGATFAGYSGALLGYEAYLYNDAIGVRSLGELPGGAHQSFAMAMNGSGTIIVGASETADGIEAFVWTNKIGMHRLKDLLLDRGVFSASSWTLEEATSITPDGLTIVGAGLDPQGRERPWIVRLDAPFDTCPGDFNLDSVTDASDFVLLASGFGMTQGATRLQGDADGDGDVDASDFVVLAGDFGCSQ
jgi:uncharacterized membrane protein